MGSHRLGVDMVGGGLRAGEHKQYQPAIDGLRALAIVAVVAFHGGLPFARGGFLGVSLFFTISGYVITSLLLREYRVNHGHVRLRKFWERRYRRLMPAALLTIGGVALAASHFADTVQRAYLRGDLLGALAYVANWRFLARGTHYADLFGAPSPVLHFWSLAIEEQFYIVFPLVVAAVLWWRKGSHRALAITLGTLIAASVAWQIALHDVDRVYYGTDTRAAELLAGALLAVALAGDRRPTRRWSVLGAGGLLVFAVLIATASVGASWIGSGGLAAVAAVNCAIVGAAAVDARALRFLGARPFTAIGRVSYGIYLFHWPVFVWLDERHTGLHGVPLAFARCAVVAAITLASYHFLECPIRYGRSLPRARRFLPATAAVAALVIAAAFVVPQPPTRPLLDVRAMPAPPAPQLAATRPTTRDPLRVMVVGNEVGQLAAWALATLPDHPFIVDNATRPRCPIVGVAYVRRFASDPPFFAAPCGDWPYRWVAEARAFKPDVVLVFSTAESDEMGRGQGTWVDIALMPLYQQVVQTYADAATILRSTGAVVAWATVPAMTTPGPSGAIGVSTQQRAWLLNSAISVVTQRQLGVVSLDYARHVNALEIARRAGPLHAKRWFENVVWLAYRAARHELALPAKGDSKRPLRVMVGGDSTSLNIAVGLANHGIVKNDVVVDWAGQIACPLVRATRFREIGQSRDFDTHSCASFSDGWATHFRSFQPDVVLVVSSFMDASALQRDGGLGWEHLGEPAFDAWVLNEFEAAYQTARKAGARVAWATAPLEDSPTDSGTNTLRQRLHRYNELLVALRLRHPDLIVVPLADHVDRPDGAVSRDERPDGVHFSADACRAIADSWLAKALLDQVKI